MDYYGGRASFVSVGEVGGQEDCDEGEEVGGCGEGLRGERGVAHGFEDRGEEDGHAAESDVAAEEHELGFSVAEHKCWEV